jgi:hypothetical protein
MNKTDLEFIVYFIANALEHWDSDRPKAKRYLVAALAKAKEAQS